MNLSARVGTIKKWKKKQDKKGKNAAEGKQENLDEKQTFLPAAEWRKKQYDEAPKWKNKAPKDLKDTKKVKGVTLHWCWHHKMWQQHTSDQCRINAAKKEGD
jgi:hypothetical protein